MWKRDKNMTEGKILPQLLMFSLPIMLTTIVQQLFNTADTMVVGRWGGDTPEACELALAAVGACGSLSSLLITLFMGLSVGAGVMVSHAVGAKEYKKIHTVVHTAITTAAICGVLIGAVGIIFARPLLNWLDTPEAVMDQAVLYMRAYFSGIPAMMVYNYCASMLRSTGDSTRPLFFLTIAGVVNVGLNLVMVIGFHQGALGVGVATAASQYVACAMILVYMRRGDGLCRFKFRHLRLHFPTLKQMLAIGIPSGIQHSMFAIGNVVMQSAVNSLNSTAVLSGSSIASTVGTYPQAIGGGFEQSVQVFVGQNVGAKKTERLRKGVLCGALLIVGVTIPLNIILNLCSGPILGIFTPDNQAVLDFAKQKLLINSMCYFLAHLGNMFAYTLIGMGKPKLSMILSIFSICGVRILWIYTVFAVFHYPLVIFASFGVSWLVNTIVQGIFYAVERRRLAKKWALSEPSPEQPLSVEAESAQ